MGPTSKGEGRDRGKGRERKEEGKEREREGPAPLTQIPGSAGFDGREKRAGCAVLKFFFERFPARQAQSVCSYLAAISTLRACSLQRCTATTDYPYKMATATTVSLGGLAFRQVTGAMGRILAQLTSSLTSFLH